MTEHYRLDRLPEWDGFDYPSHAETCAARWPQWNYWYRHPAQNENPLKAEQRDAWIMLNACVYSAHGLNAFDSNILAVREGIYRGLLTKVPPHLNGE